MTYDNSRRLPDFDLIRFIAIVMVVMIHCCSLTFQFGAENPTTVVTTSVVRVLCSLAVPFFLMISGRFLLRKQEPLDVFFRKRFRVIGISGLFWTLAYCVVQLHAGKTGVTLLKNALNGGTEYHLWFLYLIVGLYLLTPVLREFVAKIRLSRSMLAYFIGLLLVYAGCNLMNFYRAPQWGIATDNLFPFAFFPAVFLLGYQLAEREFSPRIIRLVWAVLGVSLLWMTVGTLDCYWREGKLVSFYYSIGCLPTLAAIIGAYILMDHYGAAIREFLQPVAGACRTLGEISFGIYLIHPIFLRVVGKALFRHQYADYSVFLVLPALCGFTVILSGIAVWVIGRIPYLRATVGIERHDRNAG